MRHIFGDNYLFCEVRADTPVKREAYKSLDLWASGRYINGAEIILGR